MRERSTAAKLLVFESRETHKRARLSWLPERGAAKPETHEEPKKQAPCEVAAPPISSFDLTPPPTPTITTKDSTPPESDIVLTSPPPDSTEDESLLAAAQKASHDARNDAENAMHAFVEAAVALSAIRESRGERVERDLVELARAIAMRVINRELSMDPAMLVALAREGIDALAESEAVVVKFSQDVPADLRATLAQQITERAPGTSVAFEADLAPGSCVVTSAQGYVDESVGARLDVVMEQLGFRHGDSR